MLVGQPAIGPPAISPQSGGHVLVTHQLRHQAHVGPIVQQGVSEGVPPSVRVPRCSAIAETRQRWSGRGRSCPLLARIFGQIRKELDSERVWLRIVQARDR